MKVKCGEERGSGVRWGNTTNYRKVKWGDSYTEKLTSKL